MDTPSSLQIRAYNLGLKAVPNFIILSKEQIEYYENNLDELKAAISRGFIIPESAPKPVFDIIIRVDRSVKPNYPDWFKKLEHPEFECSGPAEYSLKTDLIWPLWLHDGQKNGVVIGNIIYKHFQKDNALGSCFNLQDGLAIQQKGIAVFRKFFVAGKVVFLWGSVVQDRFGSLLVPYLFGHDGKVMVDWRWLGNSWAFRDPALRFGK